MGRLTCANVVNLSMDDMIVPSQSAQTDMRVVTLYGDVNEQTISQAIDKIMWLSAQNHEDIHLVIATYGGSLHDMFALYDICKLVQNQGTNINTVGIGKIMSAGVLLLAMGTKGKRLIGRTASVMMHNAHGGMYGNAYEMENELVETKRLQRQMIELLAENTTLTSDEIEHMFEKKLDLYMTAQRAIELGIVDKIIG